MNRSASCAFAIWADFKTENFENSQKNRLTKYVSLRQVVEAESVTTISSGLGAGQFLNLCHSEPLLAVRANLFGCVGLVPQKKTVRARKTLAGRVSWNRASNKRGSHEN